MLTVKLLGSLTVFVGLVGCSGADINSKPPVFEFNRRDQQTLAEVFNKVLYKYNIMELRNYDKYLPAEKYSKLIHTLIVRLKPEVLDNVFYEIMYRARSNFCATEAVILMMVEFLKTRDDVTAERLIRSYFDKCTKHTYSRSFCGTVIAFHSFMNLNNLADSIALFNRVKDPMNFCNLPPY